MLPSSSNLFESEVYLIRADELLKRGGDLASSRWKRLETNQRKTPCLTGRHGMFLACGRTVHAIRITTSQGSELATCWQN